MRMGIFKKWVSSILAATMILSTAAGVASAAPGAAWQGAAYFQGTDNVGKNGQGGPDGDIDYRLANTNGKHPIEFNVNVPADAPDINGADVHSVALLVRANDVDEEDGEYDQVYFGVAEPGMSPVVRKIGNLTGNNGVWNTTVFYLDPDMVRKGTNYVEITISDKTRPNYNTWEVQIDWGQIVLNGGPKDLVEIQDTPTVSTPIGNANFREINFNAIPTEAGKGGTYIAEINLLDPQGNNIGTIYQDVVIGPNDTSVPVTALFNNGGHYGDGASPGTYVPNPIQAGVTYTANVMLFERGELVSGEYLPGKVQDIWASNTPPMVKEIVKEEVLQGVDILFSEADFTNKFINLNGETDTMSKVRLTSLPASSVGSFYLDGTLKSAVGGVIEIDRADLDKLVFRPHPSFSGEVAFQWDGEDGAMYALSTAAVKLTVAVPPAVESVKLKDTDPYKIHVKFDEPINLSVGASVYGGFSVRVDGGNPRDLTVTGVTYGEDDNSVILILDQPVEPGDIAYVSYDSVPGSITDKVNIPAVLFVDMPVTRVSQPLEGWVGSRAVTDTGDIFLAPGDPLRISANSALSADRVTATLFRGQAGLEKEVELTLVSTQAGYKVWEYVHYRVADEAVTGAYTAEFASFAGGSPLPAEEVSRLANNMFNVVSSINLKGTITDAGNAAPIEGAKVTLYDAAGSTVIKDAGGSPFTTVTDASGNYSFSNIPTGNVLIVVEDEQYATKKKVIRPLPTQLGQTDIVQDLELAPFSIILTANPNTIVGDGVASSILTAVILDQNGQPAANTEVVFSAPAGTFENGYVDNGLNKVKVTTDANGKATVKYISENIDGILSQDIPIIAEVDDTAKGLHGKEQIMITFHPAVINGVITNTKDGISTPAVGAVVKITKDFDGDGIIDFSGEALTDANGHYSIAVPRGGAGIVYDVAITKPVMTNNGEVDVTFTQKAPVLQEVVGLPGEEFDSSKTITGIVGIQSPEDSNKLKMFNSATPEGIATLGKLKVYLKEVGGDYIEDGAGNPKAFSLNSDGVFNADGVDANKAYEVEIKYVISETGKPDKEIVLNKKSDGSLPTVTINADGELSIAELLVDPYGTITDGNTNAVITGAEVTLYYADTARNKTNGRTPGTKVVLPEIAGFDPNDNASPVQLSDAFGLYAYMVFPEADYYLVVTKSGYNSYTSVTIPVEFDIVRHDVKLYKPSSSGGGGSVPVQQNLGLNLSVDKSLVEEGGQSTITVDYKNESSMSLASGDITITLPEGAVVIDANGGKVDGNKITWTVKDLAAKQTGDFKIVVKWPQLDKKDASFDITGEFAVTGNSANLAAAKAATKVQVFSKRFEKLSHQRYIFGYPDGQFKAERSLTRAELAAIVARLTENNEIQTSLSFSDVPSDFWAANYIKIVTKHGYFSGFADGTFRPDEKVTRGELASVMARFLKLNISKSGELHFNDVEGHWAADAIEELYRSKFVTGYPDGSYKPKSHIIRSEAVTLINRMLYRGPLQGLKQMFPDMPASHWAFGQVQEATQSHEADRNSDGSETWVQNISDTVK
jgi:hypothetical protein